MQHRIKSCAEFVHRAQKRVSQAEVAVTGAVKHRDGMKVEFEKGQCRLANLQVEAQTHLRQFIWWGDGGRNPQIVGT